MVLNNRKEPRRISVRLRTPKGYRRLSGALIGKALNKEIGYPARVVIEEHNFYPGNLHLYCSLQVMAPYSLYLETMKRCDKPIGGHVAGVDVNVDRLNLAIVDRNGRLRDVKTFWFREVTSRGYRRKPAWTKIHQAIHAMLDYAYHHGVSHVVLESPEVIGYLRYYWIRSGDRKSRSYNFKKSIFRKVIDVITYKAPLYALKAVHVNPRGTTHSEKHDETMRRHGLDKHTASAYMTALRGLNLLKTTLKYPCKRFCPSGEA